MNCYICLGSMIRTMIQFLHSQEKSIAFVFKKLMIPGWSALLSLVFLFPAVEKTHSFAGAGPYTHIEITRLALKQLAEEKNFELLASCSEALMQASVMSDNTRYATKPEYHCDNNDIVGCSFKLDQLKRQAVNASNSATSFQRMGLALHIVQDFYAHSNWPEIFRFSLVIAPLEEFRHFPPPADLQTGLYPDIYLPDFDAQLACYFAPVEDWSSYIIGATHDCINKDSNITKRGIALVPDGGGYTFHELAAEYAVRHSVSLLKHFYANNPHFQACLVPTALTFGCNTSLLEWIR